MARDIGEAYIKIMPSTKDFGKGLTDSLLSLDGIAGAAGAALGGTIMAGVDAATTLTDAVSELGQLGDEIDKQSQKMGVSAGFYQEWDAVLQHSGTSMGSMMGTFKQLARASEAATDSQIAAFEAIGLTMDEVSNMSTEELFENVISGLQGMEEGNERTYLATQLLGRGAMELGPLLNTSSEETQGMIDTVNELGGVLSDTAIKDAARFQDNMQDMQTAMAGFTNEMLVQFLPGFNDVLAGLTAFFAGDDAGLAQITDGIRGILDKIVELIPEFIPVALEMIMGFGEAIVDNIPALIDSAIQIVNNLKDYIMNNLDTLMESAVSLVTELSNDLVENLPILIPAVIDIILQIVKILTEPENLIKLIEAAIDLMIALADGLIRAIPDIIKTIPEIIKNLVDAFKEKWPEIKEAGKLIIEQLGESFFNNSDGSLIDKIPEIIESLKKKFEDFVETFKDVGKNIISGIWEGIKGSWDDLKKKFSDLVGSLIPDAKEELEIESPSKKFNREVGQWIPKGIAVGIETNADAVTEAMNELTNSSISVGATIPSKMATQSYRMASNTQKDDVMKLLEMYLPIIASNEPKVVVEGDAQNMFRVMREQNRIFKKSTGNSAFA